MSGAYIKPFKMRGELVMNKMDKRVLAVFCVLVTLSCLPVILFPSLFWGGQVFAKPIANNNVGVTIDNPIQDEFLMDMPKGEVMSDWGEIAPYTKVRYVRFDGHLAIQCNSKGINSFAFVPGTATMAAMPSK